MLNSPRKTRYICQANIPSVAPSALGTISCALYAKAGAHAPACIPADLRPAAKGEQDIYCQTRTGHIMPKENRTYIVKREQDTIDGSPVTE